MVMKICDVCGTEFDAKGRAKTCSSECSKVNERSGIAKRSKIYYHRDIEGSKEKGRLKYYKYKEKYNERSRNWRMKNKEYASELSKAWAKINRERVNTNVMKLYHANPHRNVEKYLLSKHDIENPPEELVAAIVEMRKIKRELKEQQP